MTDKGFEFQGAGAVGVMATLRLIWVTVVLFCECKKAGMVKEVKHAGVRRVPHGYP